MLVQSFQGAIRVFPDWPSGTDAKFANLAAYGGFLVASEMSQNAIPYVAITSQNGGTLTVANPWPQGQLVDNRNGSSAPALSGSMLTMQTSPCDVVVLAPAGTSYQRLERPRAVGEHAHDADITVRRGRPRARGDILCVGCRAHERAAAVIPLDRRVATGIG
jgi:hypothetical protein